MIKSLEYHNGPLDGKRLDVESPMIPEDAEYIVRTDETGHILGAWWTPVRPECV